MDSVEPDDTPTDTLPPLVEDTKYIVFKRSEFYQMLGFVLSEASLAGLNYEMPLALNEVDRIYLRDAVVIRRQDNFAAMALATYANSIGLVASTTPDEILARRLTNVADYFHQQSEAAAEQGYKFPD